MLFGLAWWLFAIEIAFLGAILFSVGHRRLFLSGFFTALASVSWWVFSGFPNVFDIFNNHGQIIAIWSIIYLLVGLVWGVVNWLLFTRSEEMRTEIRSQFNYYLLSVGDGGTVADFKKSHYYPFGFSKDFPLIADSVIWWPLSMIWMVFNDLLRDVANFMGRQLSGFFAAIAGGSVDAALKDHVKKP